ncbi:MAG: protease complex subunit PrcB family protein [Firmicutes bacterium]|nr:protease complex subunit PrcB family protein [Bacillota bacterium]
MEQKVWYHYSTPVLILGLAVTLSWGCTGKTGQADQPGKSTQPGKPTQSVQSVGQKDKGGKTPVPFTIVDIATAPKGLKEIALQNREKSTATGMELGGRAYLLVTRGVKSSGGYGVEITSVTQETKAGRPVIVVGVKYTDPLPDQVVTEALTYPMTAAQLNLKTIPYGLSFIFTTD